MSQTPEQTPPTKKHWLKANLLPIVFLSLIITISLFAIYVTQHQAPQQLATVTVGGEVLFVYDLNNIQQSETHLIEQGTLFNEIQVHSQRIAVTSANCPDQICVLQGFSQGDGKPIVCLPHQVVITFSSTEEKLDFVTG